MARLGGSFAAVEFRRASGCLLPLRTISFDSSMA
jgi:hypothetical protein